MLMPKRREPRQVRFSPRWYPQARSAHLCFRRLACVALLLGLPAASKAVIVFGTGDPAHNTTAPTGALIDSGWQYQGAWGVYLGTPISSNFFITGAHVGGRVG